MPNTHAPFYPIIYVRGYAMTHGEIDETTADPFCGFNLGSTVYRATTNKAKPNKFVFESPVVRLMSDFGYTDVFKDGYDITDPDWDGSIPNKSIIVYHYYDQASTLLGTGTTPDISEFATGLNKLILTVKKLVCKNPDNQVLEGDFRCYLVAHSMGGLVCRAFLQNPKYGDDSVIKCVDKVFTYATPHNGIEVFGMNVPDWISMFGVNTFNRDKMFSYLNLEGLFSNLNDEKRKEREKRVDWLHEERFPSKRFFCMIGTNRGDYEAAKSIARMFSGQGSDGLVRIENASVWGVNNNGEVSVPCATAYTYRSHSGYFGIVNGEESYQNLTRFLFGRVRADIWFDVTDIRLPKELEKIKEVNALYQFEVMASPLSKRWYLTRRMAEEDSVACRTHKELMCPSKESARSIYLSTVFLDDHDPQRHSLSYSVTLGVRVPDYEVDRSFMWNKHYEGGYLFRDSVVIDVKGSSDFSKDEFKPPLAIEILCKVIVNDNDSINLNSAKGTIDWLNELLMKPDFYDTLRDKKPVKGFSRDIMDLVDITKNYRNVRFSDLKDEMPNYIKRLNRLLLEETYSQEIPKSLLQLTSKDLRILYNWQSEKLGEASEPVKYNKENHIIIPIECKTTPGINGILRFVVSAWNT